MRELDTGGVDRSGAGSVADQGGAGGVRPADAVYSAAGVGGRAGEVEPVYRRVGVAQAGYRGAAVGAISAGLAGRRHPASAPNSSHSIMPAAGYPARLRTRPADGKPGLGGDISVSATISRSAAPGRTYWLVAARDYGGVNAHRVYYTRQQLPSTVGTSTTILYFGHEIHSTRNLEVVDADTTATPAVRWSLGHPGPEYGVDRVSGPQDLGYSKAARR